MPAQTFTDQLGNEVSIPFPPKRIISLVPSQTELLSSLGLDSEVVGLTKFCVHPLTWRKAKRVVGGTKNFNMDVIAALQPDLIIGNKEENYKEGIESLMQHYPVWMSDIITQQDALEMIRQVGALTDKITAANRLVTEIQAKFNELTPIQNQRVLYLIWKKPWMGVGSETFIHDMLRLAGFTNCLYDKNRYPELSTQELIELNPEVVFLSSEPYPFKEKHVQEIKAILPNSKVVLVDGEMFSWYGSRMLHFPEYIAKLRTLLI